MYLVKIEHTPPRFGDRRHTQASIEKAERLLQCYPTVGFEDSMRRTFEHLRAQPGKQPQAARKASEIQSERNVRLLRPLASGLRRPG